MIYEERRYNVLIAKKPELLELLRETVIPLLTKYGAKIIAVWDTAIGLRNEVVVLLAFDDISKRMECWDSLSQEEVIQKAVPTMPCQQVNIGILRPLDFSPMQ